MVEVQYSELMQGRDAVLHSIALPDGT